MSLTVEISGIYEWQADITAGAGFLAILEAAQVVGREQEAVLNEAFSVLQLIRLDLVQHEMDEKMQEIKRSTTGSIGA